MSTITDTPVVATTGLSQAILDVARPLSISRVESVDTESQVPTETGTVGYFAEILTCDGHELMLTDDPVNLVELVKRGVSADFLSMAPTTVEVSVDMNIVTVVTTWSFITP